MAAQSLLGSPTARAVLELLRATPGVGRSRRWIAQQIGRPAEPRDLGRVLSGLVAAGLVARTWSRRQTFYECVEPLSALHGRSPKGGV